jgi:hypothetical protein
MELKKLVNNKRGNHRNTLPVRHIPPRHRHDQGDTGDYQYIILL